MRVECSERRKRQGEAVRRIRDEGRDRQGSVFRDRCRGLGVESRTGSDYHNKKFVDGFAGLAGNLSKADPRRWLLVHKKITTGAPKGRLEWGMYTPGYFGNYCSTETRERLEKLVLLQGTNIFVPLQEH